MLTLPVSTTEFVLGKALALVTYSASVGGYPAIAVQHQSYCGDRGPIYAGYLAALLLAFAYLAIGLFVSASINSQIVTQHGRCVVW